MLPNDNALFDASFCFKKCHDLLYLSFMIVLPAYGGCFTHGYDSNAFRRRIRE